MDAMAGRRVVQIVGDGITGHWATWRWSDGASGGQVARVRGLEKVTKRLHQALPRDPEHLGFDGELVDPEREYALMRELSEVLLPERLRHELRDCAEQGDPLHVRVAPTPLAAEVPWGLLPVDADRRLLDIADVSWIAPLLPRDLAGPVPPAFQTLSRSAPSLHVIDPKQYLGQVMGPQDRRALAKRATGSVHEGSLFGAAKLAESLQAGVSRLVFIGHTLRARSASSTGFVLSDVVRGVQDALTAEELIADPARWPMPPRVAVLACASGADMADHEPFGLATAILHNGADTVHATLWTLPTDQAFRTSGRVAEPVLLPMALAFDEAQSADDPVAALCDWQRYQLRRWREAPSLATSPLSWGAALTMTAPPRVVILEEEALLLGT